MANSAMIRMLIPRIKKGFLFCRKKRNGAAKSWANFAPPTRIAVNNPTWKADPPDWMIMAGITVSKSMKFMAIEKKTMCQIKLLKLCLDVVESNFMDGKDIFFL